MGASLWPALVGAGLVACLAWAAWAWGRWDGAQSATARGRARAAARGAVVVWCLVLGLAVAGPGGGEEDREPMYSVSGVGHEDAGDAPVRPMVWAGIGAVLSVAWVWGVACAPGPRNAGPLPGAR